MGGTELLIVEFEVWPTSGCESAAGGGGSSFAVAAAGGER